MSFLYLPLAQQPRHGTPTLADAPTAQLIQDGLRVRFELAQTVFQSLSSSEAKAAKPATADQIDEVLITLTHRRFNHQTRSRLGPLMALYRQKLAVHMTQGRPIPCFYLYNGGYRASPWAQQPFIFEPDATELLLLVQIARLAQAMEPIYPPGFRFLIVINNGVAHWVNGIAVTSTEAYAQGLNNMIEAIGAGERVSVVLQSALSTFDSQAALPAVTPSPVLSEKDHRLVERFLGRACSEREARHRHALYALAEAHWAQVLAPLVQAHDGLLFKQVASPQMLSFRPFHGGAIRTQNGSIGFALQDQHITPQLITTQTTRHHTILGVPWTAPWANPSQPPDSA